MSKFSVNNRFIAEAYKTDKALRSKVTNGFATIDQKGTLKPLKILVDTYLTAYQTSAGSFSIPKLILAGSLIYVKEETLHNAVWAKTALEAPGVDGQFIIVGLENVEMIEEL